MGAAMAVERARLVPVALEADTAQPEGHRVRAGLSTEGRGVLTH